MIVILSEGGDHTTIEVLQWIRAHGADVLRFNREDLGRDWSLQMAGTEVGLGIQLGGRSVHPDAVGAVWFRRWGPGAAVDVEELGSMPGATAPNVEELRKYLKGESRAAGDFVLSLFGAARWLSHPRSALRSNKLADLRLAARAGLDVPRTLVANRRAEVIAFLDRCGRVVTKPMGPRPLALRDRSALHFLYTSEVTPAQVARAPDSFSPTLFQELIEKRYELRVFYLAGRCHAMAIFSQEDPQTQVDFRRYNYERPNRTVPYQLPEDIEEKIGRFMAARDLDTGSLDLIRTQGGRHVFLEVNPVGQFGMVSFPCNYFLERQVAQHLLNLDREASG